MKPTIALLFIALLSIISVVLSIPSNPVLTITPFLPTDTGYYVHILIPVTCRLDTSPDTAATKCTQLSSFSYSTTPVSTSSNYLFNSIFASLRFPDGTVQFLSNSKGTAFAKDKLNHIELPPVSFPTPFRTATLQITFSITAPSMVYVNRFKTGKFQLAFDLDDGTVYNLHPDEFNYIPATIADHTVFNNTLAVKNPVTTDTFQFLIDTAIDHSKTDLYTSVTATSTTPSLAKFPIPPISTVYTLTTPTEFSFTKYADSTLASTYPSTLQSANCFFNSFPVNATISDDASQLLFQPVLSNIIGLLARDRPVIQCRDIHLRNSQTAADNIQYKYTSLILTKQTTEKTLVTEIVDGKINSSVTTTETTEQTAYPIQFYVGVLPQLVIGTTIYQPYDLSRTASTGSTIPPGLVDSTSGNSDHYRWDVEYPFQTTDVLDTDQFHSLRDHHFISPAFLSFPLSSPSGITYANTARNIVKIRHPYSLIETEDGVAKIPTDFASLYTNPTLNITAAPGSITALTPFVHLWRSSLDEYYAPHFSFSFTNLIDRKVNKDTSIQSLTLSLPLTPLTTNISKQVQVTFRTTPAIFTSPQLPTQTFSSPGAELDFIISADWFSNTASYHVARIASLGVSSFTGFLHGCSATQDHAPIPSAVIVPTQSYKFIELDAPLHIQQQLQQQQQQQQQLLDAEQPQPQQTPNPNSIFTPHTYSFYIYFQQAVRGDVRIQCQDAHRFTNITSYVTPSTAAVPLAPVDSSVDIITVGTDHYGPIIDKVVLSHANVRSQLWSPRGIAGDAPAESTDENDGLSTGLIVLIVICSIIGEIILMIGCWFGIKYYGLPWYREYKQQQAQYERQQDRPDIVQIVKETNGVAKKGKKKRPAADRA